MSDIPTDSIAGVLHVRPCPGRSVCADDMDTSLKSAGLPVEICFDVYRGLAKACKDSGSSFRALVLCMDVLGSFELEFFTVIARARPKLPVYIYGETAEGTRKAQALDSGAISDATDDIIDRLTGAHPVTPQIDTALDDRLAQEADACEPKAFALEDSAQAQACGSVLDEPVEPVVPAVPESEEEDDPPVQVPWLSRGGSPPRRGPGERNHSEDAPEPAGTRGENAPIRGPHEPLLTNEELRALMGDDMPEASAADPFDEGDRR